MSKEIVILAIGLVAVFNGILVTGITADYLLGVARTMGLIVR